MNKIISKLKETIIMLKEKKLVGLVLGVVVLFITVISATYAYYTLEVSNKSTSSNINVQMGELNSIAIKGLIPELHLNVSVSDMSLENATIYPSYYATKEKTEHFKTNQEEATYDIAKVVIIGNVTEKHKCTGKLTIEIDKSMASVLREDDAYLYISGGNVNETIDLSKLEQVDSKRSKTYNIEFLITDPEEDYKVKSYIELKNKETEQNYLAGKELGITIKIEEFSCISDMEAPTISKFYINSEGTPKYTNNNNVQVHLEWLDDDVTDYCISENDSYQQCQWQKVEGNNKQIIKDMTLTGTGNVTRYAYLKDKVGNISHSASDSITIDTDKPTITKYYINEEKTGQKYTKTNSITHHIEYSDTDIEKVCITTTNNVGSCQWQNVSSTKTYTETISTEGKITYYAFIKDKAGNTSGVKEDNIIYDKTLPTITNVTATNQEYTSLTANVVANDGSGSGIDKYCFGTNVDSNANYVCQTGSTYPYSNLQAGTTYNIYIYVIDKAGNQSVAKSYPLRTKEKPASEIVYENAVGQIETEQMKSARPKDTLRRFQSTDKDAIKNNYICFGTTDKNQCTSNKGTYMYRIIGVVAENDTTTGEKVGMLKIIKQTPLSSTYKWHSAYRDDSYTWNNVMLYKQLNGLDTGDSANYPYNIFLTNTTYVPNTNVGSKAWKDILATIKWRYGDIYSSSDYASGTAVLAKEKTWTDTVEAKIGLMYLSDYYLAYDNTTNWKSGFETTNWLHTANNGGTVPYEWTMSRRDSSYAWYVRGNGRVYYDYDLTASDSVRPVFYLSEELKIKSGTTGAIDNPYIIDSVSE